MNSNSDTLRSFLLGLLTYFSPTVSSPSGSAGGDRDSQSTQSGPTGASSDPRQGADGSEPAAFATSNHTTYDLPPLSELGEMPAVQTHVQALLKRRLQVEIERRPPLFPWETELQDYPINAEVSDRSPMWLPQLRSLNLPTALPPEVLSSLLTRCQTLAQAALKPGVQLVRAVEELFPEQPQAVNQIAGLMLAGATRDGQGLNVADLSGAFPQGYAGANPQQQVTLTMLAAREIFDALTLAISDQLPTVQRRWETTAGTVQIQVAYHPAAMPTLQIEATLPEAGYLSLGNQEVTGGKGEALTLTLPEPEENRFYALEVGIANGEALTFTLVLRS